MRNLVLLFPILAAGSLASCDSAQSEHWKASFIREVNYHYQTQQIKVGEIEELKTELNRMRKLVAGLPETAEGRNRPPEPDEPFSVDPFAAPEAFRRLWIDYGLFLHGASSDLLDHLGVETGSVVHVVREGSPAEAWGFMKGDVIAGSADEESLAAFEQSTSMAIIRQGRAQTLSPQ